MTDTPPQNIPDDFLGFLEDDRLAIPHVPSTKYPREVGGHTYMVEQPNAVEGARLATLGTIMQKMAHNIEVAPADVERLQMDDAGEVQFSKRVLGDVYDEMLRDGVNHNALKIATNFAFIAFAFNEGAAREMASKGSLSGKDVPPPQPNRAQRRAASTRSNGQATATTSRARKK